MMKHFVSLKSSIGDQVVAHGPTRRLKISDPGSWGKVYLPWKDRVDLSFAPDSVYQEVAGSRRYSIMYTPLYSRDKGT